MDLKVMANWDQPVFPMSVVAEAAGVKAATLRKWAERGHLIPRGDDVVLLSPEPDSRPGVTRLLTFRSALHVGLMVALTKAGVDPSDAYVAGIRWLHVGDSWAGYTNESVPDAIRGPGELYEGDGVVTVLLHFMGPEAVIAKATINRGGITFKLDDLRFWEQTIAQPPKIVFLKPLVEQMRAPCEQYLRSKSR